MPVTYKPVVNRGKMIYLLFLTNPSLTGEGVEEIPCVVILVLWSYLFPKPGIYYPLGGVAQDEEVCEFIAICFSYC